MSWFSSQNVMLFDSCKNLHGLNVELALTEDLIAFRDGGFSLQLNAYPPKGQLSQGQELTWFQYSLYVDNGSYLYQIQYWASNPVAWPKG
jgi:hypothetical protein